MRHRTARNGISYLVAGFLVALLAVSAQSQQETALRTTVEQANRSPNILLIMTDDQGWGDLYSHGQTDLDTPNLDRLATQGARFDRFYVSPVCAPTRASVMTGRYYLRTGVADVTRGLETMRSREVTLAETLQDSGYETALFGKWHLGSHYPNTPLGQGFSTFFGFHSGHWNNYFDPILLDGREPVQTEGFITDVITERTVSFLKNRDDSPFFAFVSYNAPHSPYQVPDPYFEKYTSRGYGPKQSAVYGMVDNIDENVGRLLKTLREEGLEENTIVVFMTDNGPNGDRYNGGMKGNKGKLHEGGVRVPLFIRWPGRINQSQIIRKHVAHIDLLPTLLEWTGTTRSIDAPPLDGRSFAPLLNDSDAKWPDRMIFHHRGLARNGIQKYRGAVRTPRYRLVCRGTPCELYDMIQDPGETNNIAKQHPERTDRLRRAFEHWFADVTAGGVERPPIPVGHSAAPEVELPIWEAYFTDDLSYSNGSGYGHEWLTGWTSPQDSVWWEVNVVAAGKYQVSALYTLPEGAEAASVQVRTSGNVVTGTLPPTGKHEPTVRPERDPETNRLVKDFARASIGRLHLAENKQTLRIRLARTLGDHELHLQALRLRKIRP